MLCETNLREVMYWHVRAVVQYHGKRRRGIAAESLGVDEGTVRKYMRMYPERMVGVYKVDSTRVSHLALAFKHRSPVLGEEIHGDDGSQALVIAMHNNPLTGKLSSVTIRRTRVPARLMGYLGRDVEVEVE